MELILGIILLLVIYIILRILKAGAQAGYDKITEPSDALKKTQRDADRVVSYLDLTDDQARYYRNTQVFGTCFARFSLLVANADGQLDQTEISSIFRFFAGADKSYLEGIRDSMKKDLSTDAEKIDWEHCWAAARALFEDPNFSDYDTILFDGLLSISAADGNVSKVELDVIIYIMSQLGWASERIHAFIRNRFSSPQQSPIAERRLEALRILGLQANATQNEIKSAYRNLAKQHHPDKYAHMGSHFQKSAEDRFRQVKEAYDILNTSNVQTN